MPSHGRPPHDLSGHLRPALTLAVALGAALLILTLGQQAFAQVAAFAMSGASAAMVEAAFTFALFGLLLVVALVGMRIDPAPRAEPALPPIAAVAGGAAIGAFGLGCAAALAALAGNAQAGTGEAGPAILIGTLTILFQAGVEELYFRGWLQPVLVRRWRPAAGLIVTSLAFATLHLAGGARSPLTLLNLLLGGILFGLLALRSGGLLAPIAAHAAWNWAEQILLGLDPNPGTGSFGALFDLDLVGTATWGGSDEGLNASLALSFALVALIVPLALLRRGRQDAATAPARHG
jgi:membrane protease YdiL (CAAX protease family)